MQSKWGSQTEKVDVICNVQQAEATRDALAKGLYSRLFDYLVKVCYRQCVLTTLYQINYQITSQLFFEI